MIYRDLFSPEASLWGLLTNRDINPQMPPNSPVSHLENTFFSIKLRKYAAKWREIWRIGELAKMPRQILIFFTG